MYVLVKALFVGAGFNFSISSLQLVKLAKRLKKEKVNVDIVSFGEEVSSFICVLARVFAGFNLHVCFGNCTRLCI